MVLLLFQLYLLLSASPLHLLHFSDDFLGCKRLVLISSMEITIQFTRLLKSLKNLFTEATDSHPTFPKAEVQEAIPAISNFC